MKKSNFWPKRGVLFGQKRKRVDDDVKHGMPQRIFFEAEASKICASEAFRSEPGCKVECA